MMLENDKQLAVYEDALNMANIAVWSVELQTKRLRSGKNEIEEFVMQPVVDFHYLVTSLHRLRKMALMVSSFIDITGEINKFDDALPDLKTIRNILEHIDDYRVGRGNNKSVSKSTFQTISISNDYVYWSDYEINLNMALAASADLYSAIKNMPHNKSFKVAASQPDAVTGAA